MKKQILILLGLAFMLTGTNICGAPMDGRILILNFECSGLAAGHSEAIGDSLRSHIVKLGGKVVSHSLFEQLISGKGKKESALNSNPDELKSLFPQLNAVAAVYGKVYMVEGMLTMDLKFIAQNSEMPLNISPFVIGNLRDLYGIIPEAARIILSTDKEAPRVLTVIPSDSSKGVEQYIEMKISFSEPMNPSTFSLEARPENMWSRYGEVQYDSAQYSFIFKIHLYRDIDYEFAINGGKGRGFKDLTGNPAQEYIWKFSTKR
jgi:hypothetical protein